MRPDWKDLCVIDWGSELSLIDMRSPPGVPWQDGDEKEAVGKDHSGNNAKGQERAREMSDTEMRSREAGLGQDNWI